MFLNALGIRMFEMDFMKNALLAVLLLGPLFGLLSTMIVTGKMSFFSDALGHSGFTGIAIGVLCGAVQPIYFAVGLSVLFALLFSFVRSRTSQSADTIIGVFSSTAVALGIFIVTLGGRSFTKFNRYLIGDILSVSPQEIGLLALVLLFLLVLVVSCLFVDPTKLVEKPSPYFRFLLNQFSRLAFDLGGVRVHVTGLDKVPRKGRFLLISNHLFAFDPIVFYYAMPWAELAFISKTENFSLYIVAQVMRKILCLPLDRNNDREALKSILKAIQFLKEDKASIAVFPEGGTSKSGLLQPFRNGAFKIAQKANVPIVVCALSNTKAILKNMFRRRTDVHLDVLDVIPAETVASLKTTVEIGDYAPKILSEGLAKRGVATAQPS